MAELPAPHDDHDDAGEPSTVAHASLEQLEAGLAEVARSPSDRGRVELLVVRPSARRRATPSSAELSVEHGLEGDGWASRGSRRTPDGRVHPDMQVALINARLLQLIARDRARWPLAGDQLVVDLDLGVDNLAAGDRLAIGSAVAEVTAQPHTGCRKFAERYGRDALRLVTTARAREGRLRGMYVRVVSPGTVRVGDTVAKVRAA